MADARLHARLHKLVLLQIDSLIEYGASEATGLRVLASAVDLLQRLQLTQRACSDGGAGEARRLLGPLVQFHGVAEASVARHAEELRRTLSNVSLVLDALRAAQTKIVDASRLAQEELSHAPRGTAPLMARTPEQPASIADAVGCAYELRACVARDFLRKLDVAAVVTATISAALPTAGHPLSDVSLTDDARESSSGGVVGVVEAALQDWPSPLTRHLLEPPAPPSADTRGSDAPARADLGIVGAAVYPGDVRAADASAWRSASAALWRVTGRHLPFVDVDAAS